ncbi:MAG: Re/Si-specific NAD(P)(+) transhydrogenase subunit alpha [Thermomicrobiales bacterium]
MEGQTGSALTTGVPRETAAGEHRVALTPDIVKRLTAKGVIVKVQSGAGRGAGHDDAAYEAAGARIVPAAAGAYDADMVIKVQKPTPEEAAQLRPGSTLIALLQPLTNHDLVSDLAARDITSFSMDAIPRTTRAQSMDVLSSQATAAGYKAVLLAATALPKFFPMLTTAAGSIVPAKVLIVGAGVAGLQAIATARRLGAVVEAYDTRPVVKEQVESLGAKFVDIPVDTSDTQTAGGYAKEVSAETLRRQQEVLADRAIKSDVVITTAAVPGRPAPRLISRETVERMRPGSVIVDLAAETGGNVEATRAGETVDVNGVTIIGQLNLPSTMAVHSSQMYAKNIENLLALLITKDGAFKPDYEDEIVKGTVITRNRDVVHAMTRERMAASGAAPAAPTAPTAPAAPAPAVPEPVPPPAASVAAPVVETANGSAAGSAMGIVAPPETEAEKLCPPGAVVGPGGHECPEHYPIKGNASSLIYHVPGGGSYERTIPEFCFATEGDAEAAGYRAAR